MLDVAIVGGGLCGLAIAHSLQARRQGWALYEARDRLGGRVLTAHCAGQDGRPGAAVDLGATWFWPDTQPRMARLVADLGLTVLPQHDDDTALSFDDAAEPPRTVRTERLHGGGQRLAGGMVSLIDALAGRLPAERLHLGTELLGLYDRGDHVELRLRAASADVLVVARCVVLALPPRVAAERVQFNPALAAEVEAALRAVPTWMAVAAKAACGYQRAFWREAGHSGNALVTHPQAVLSEVFDACGADGERAALAGFYALDPQQRKHFKGSLDLLTRSQLAQLFGAVADEGELHRQDWALEPHTCSTWDLQDPATHHPRYADARLTHPLWDGRLWLAGSETAGAGGGYLEGALAAAGRVRQGLAPMQAQPPANVTCMQRFGSWVADERSRALERYRQTLHRELSGQRSEQLTQRVVLDVVGALYREALLQLAALPFERRDVPVQQGRSALTPGLLQPFDGFSDELLAQAVQFNRTSCALSNFPHEAKPAWDYVSAIRRDLAAAWREFALAANDLMLCSEAEPA